MPPETAPSVASRHLVPERAAALVVAVGIVGALHVGKLPPAIPVLKDALGVTLVQAGFLQQSPRDGRLSVGRYRRSIRGRWK